MENAVAHDVQYYAIQVTARLVSPFFEFIFPDSLIWWPVLLSALLLAAAWFCVADGRGLAALGEFRRRYLSRAIWGHRSAQVDYAYFIVNTICFPAIVGPLVLSGAALTAAMQAGLTYAFGPVTVPLFDSIVARTLYTILFFLAYDFGRFVAHNLLHEVPLLWEFHRVHHSAEVLTPMTNYRLHPIDLFVMQVCPNLATGLLSGVFFYLCGGAIGFYSFFGLHIGIAAFNAIGNLRHWHVWITFGPTLGRWLISPAHHQVHHSREARHLGKNRGFELAIWDRMFGSLYVPNLEESFAMGLGDGTDGAWNSVGRLYVWPFRYAMARIGLARAPLPDSKN
jgi:sterol desaturase/sphingolipid hydroxylase (fatty acid hydroxylase superfamily)